MSGFATKASRDIPTLIRFNSRAEDMPVGFSDGYAWHPSEVIENILYLTVSSGR
jgi:hypothetical protein